MRRLLAFAALFAAIGVALAVAAAGDAKKPCRLSNTCPPTTTPTATTPPPTTTTPPPPPTSGAIRASGRSLVDSAGNAVCSPTAPCKGFNLHAVPWAQSHFDDMKAIGAKVGRVVVRWDDFEPSQGVFDSAKVAALDATVARMRTAGLYTILSFHLLSDAYPSWTLGVSSEEGRYTTYGRTLTQFLANRYGNTSSAQYASNVIGMGLNEVPISSSTIRNGPNNVPHVESVQRQMIQWMRESAPQWIGFVGYGWAAASPLPGGGTESTVRTDLVPADPHAYDSVGGNVVIDAHDYMWGDTRTSPPYDGRQWNGMIWPVWQGGTQIGPGDETNYVSSTMRRDQQRQWWLPYKTFTTNAQIPLMVGEWGWQTGLTGDQAFLADKKPRWADAGAALQLYWIYNVCTCADDPWAARPGGVWRPVVTGWLTG